MPVLHYIQSQLEGTVCEFWTHKPYIRAPTTNSHFTVSCIVAYLSGITYARRYFLAWEPEFCNQAYGIHMIPCPARTIIVVLGIEDPKNTNRPTKEEYVYMRRGMYSDSIVMREQLSQLM
jgi:hypothetical protein